MNCSRHHDRDVHLQRRPARKMQPTPLKSPHVRTWIFHGAVHRQAIHPASPARTARAWILPGSHHSQRRPARRCGDRYSTVPVHRKTRQPTPIKKVSYQQKSVNKSLLILSTRDRSTVLRVATRSGPHERNSETQDVHSQLAHEMLSGIQSCFFSRQYMSTIRSSIRTRPCLHQRSLDQWWNISCMTCLHCSVN